MRNNMRGFIEPYTLGFLLAMVGTSLGYLAREAQEDGSKVSEVKSEVIIKTTSDEKFVSK
jgi:hypothetical protein